MLVLVALGWGNREQSHTSGSEALGLGSAGPWYPHLTHPHTYLQPQSVWYLVCFSQWTLTEVGGREEVTK